MSENTRLREARKAAGFPSSRAAAQHHAWKVTTYAAHENGQNGYGREVAETYATAFGVSPAWLLLGDEGVVTIAASEAPGGKDHRVPVMMTANEVIAIDDWGFANRVRSRSEAIRRLCAMALAKQGTAP